MDEGSAEFLQPPPSEITPRSEAAQLAERIQLVSNEFSVGTGEEAKRSARLKIERELDNPLRTTAATLFEVGRLGVNGKDSIQAGVILAVIPAKDTLYSSIESRQSARGESPEDQALTIRKGLQSRLKDLAADAQELLKEELGDDADLPEAGRLLAAKLALSTTHAFRYRIDNYGWRLVTGMVLCKNSKTRGQPPEAMTLQVAGAKAFQFGISQGGDTLTPTSLTQGSANNLSELADMAKTGKPLQMVTSSFDLFKGKAEAGIAFVPQYDDGADRDFSRNAAEQTESSVIFSIKAK